MAHHQHRGTDSVLPVVKRGQPFLGELQQGRVGEERDAGLHSPCQPWEVRMILAPGKGKKDTQQGRYEHPKAGIYFSKQDGARLS